MKVAWHEVPGKCGHSIFVLEGQIDRSLAQSAWEMWAQWSVPEGTV
jgi:hypothetical protein